MHFPCAHKRLPGLYWHLWLLLSVLTAALVLRSSTSTVYYVFIPSRAALGHYCIWYFLDITVSVKSEMRVESHGNPLALLILVLSSSCWLERVVQSSIIIFGIPRNIRNFVLFREEAKPNKDTWAVTEQAAGFFFFFFLRRRSKQLWQKRRRYRRACGRWRHSPVLP